MDKEKKALEVLRAGGILIFPTDTAFGIGCAISKSKSVDRLFQLRRRPTNQAMPVLVSSENMARTYLKSPSPIVRHLMKKYWPGALTIVAPCNQDLLYAPIRGGGSTVGLRMPQHAELLRIISDLGEPIVGPSANFHGENTPYKSDDLNPQLVKQVDYLLAGKCSIGTVSTVVDCSVSPYVIIRNGACVVLPEDQLDW